MSSQWGDGQFVRTVLDDYVLTVTIDRPEVRNALNFEAYAELTEAFRRARTDNDVRCIVVTGTDPAFCSGDDVKQIMIAGAEKLKERRTTTIRHRLSDHTAALLECERPVIAAVNGPAIGWGMELAVCADIRIASDRARFSLMFVKRGVIPDAGTFAKLPGIVGSSRAAELMFTGDVIDAAEAERIGLVSRVVPHDELLASTYELAGRIAANAPLATRFMKDGLRRVGPDLPELGAWVNSAYAVLFATEDHREGAQAFLEKREPRFQGR
jgi:enoyl-CoA hydratase/carnithine racemase